MPTHSDVMLAFLLSLFLFCAIIIQIFGDPLMLNSDIPEQVRVHNMSQADKIERLREKIKTFYGIELISFKLVKNQTNIYTAKTSIGTARIYVYSQCADIKFTTAVSFDGEQLVLKQPTPIIQTIFDDINQRTVVFHAVKLRTTTNKCEHFYTNTKFSIKIVVRYSKKNPQLYFKATPYSKYAFFTYMYESVLAGYEKTVELSYIKDEFESISGIDQPFSFIKNQFKGRMLTLDDAKRLGQLSDMVTI